MNPLSIVVAGINREGLSSTADKAAAICRKQHFAAHSKRIFSCVAHIVATMTAHPPPCPAKPGPLPHWLAAGTGAALLVVLVLWVFSPVRDHQFVAWDDTSYVVDNALVRTGITLSGISAAFADFHLSNWHPLTLLSHMLDVSLWGMNAGAHAMTNVTLHMANVLMLFALILRLDGSAIRLPAALAAASLWAVHPLHVESVAWISERKDVLSTAFWLLALHSYISWTSRRRAFNYALTSIATACALMAKPMAITLPLTMICLDLWPLCRIPADGWRTSLRLRIAEKWLWWLMAVGVAGLTMAAQHRAMPDISLVERLTTGLASYAWYLVRTFWPTDLHFYYLSEAWDGWVPAALGFAMLAAITVWTTARFRDRPWLLAGWLWFVVTLLPVAGFVKVGTQAVADRYAYVPHIGLLLMLAPELLRLTTTRARATAFFLAAMATAGLALASHRQTDTWRDTRALYGHALAIEPEHYVALMGLANLALRENALHDARRLATQALERSHGPGLVNAMRIVLGEVALRENHLDEAIRQFKQAETADPTDGVAPFRQGTVLLIIGDAAAAESCLRRAMARGETGPELNNALGVSLAMQQRVAEARGVLQAAAARWPEHAGLAANLARIKTQ